MKVVLEYKNSSRRVEILADSINKTLLDDLVSTEFAINNVTYKIFDKDFGIFVDLDNYQEIQNFSRIQVNAQEIEPVAPVVIPIEIEVLTPDPTSNLRQRPWRFNQYTFNVNSFGLSHVKELTEAQALYEERGIIHKCSAPLKPVINATLHNIMIEYTLYPSHDQKLDVCMSLVRNIPCLFEQKGIGCDSYLNSLTSKLSEYRRNHPDHPEVILNRGKEFKRGRTSRRGNRGEVNFAPPAPLNYTRGMLLEFKDWMLREAMVVKEERNYPQIKEYMELTFSLRRDEINQTNTPTIRELVRNWPFLFQPDFLLKEMFLITRVNVAMVFMQNITLYGAAMIEEVNYINRERGKTRKGRKRQAVDIDPLDVPNQALEETYVIPVQNSGADTQVPEASNNTTLQPTIFRPISCPPNMDMNQLLKIEDALRHLPKMLSEKYSFCSEVLDSKHPSAYITLEDDDIVLRVNETLRNENTVEETTVVKQIDNFLVATQLLICLYYALNLVYPPPLSKTFSFLQKCLCEVQSEKCEKPVESLFTKLSRASVNTSVT